MEWVTLRKEKKESEIKKLYIEPTSRCNLSCKMCFRHKWIDESLGDMSEETFSEVMKYLREHRSETVFFGGMGEPLIHKNLTEMIKAVSEYSDKTEVLTNCTLLSEEMAKELIECGLTRLWVSMDGFSKDEYEKIRLGGRFDLICGNLKRFNELRKGTAVKLGITFVVMEDNLNQLKYINSFADEFDVDLMNISHAIPMYEDASAREFFDADVAVGKMERYTGEKPDKPFDYCPFVEEKMCFVKWNGDVVPCMQLLHSSETYMFDIKRNVYAHSFGNVGETPLFDIYNNEEYRAFRERVMNFEFPSCIMCEGCELREDNKEDCMFNGTPTCGACLWSTGKVFCP